MEREFPALRIAVKFLKIIAWIVSGVIALAGVFALFSGTAATEPYGVVGAIGLLVVAALTWLSGMILPELIEVLLAIEENTRPRHAEHKDVAA